MRLESILDEEVERFSVVYFKPKQRQSAMDHQAMTAMTKPMQVREDSPPYGDSS